MLGACCWAAGLLGCWAARLCDALVPVQAGGLQVEVEVQVGAGGGGGGQQGRQPCGARRGRGRGSGRRSGRARARAQGLCGACWKAREEGDKSLAMAAQGAAWRRLTLHVLSAPGADGLLCCCHGPAVARALLPARRRVAGLQQPGGRRRRLGKYLRPTRQRELRRVWRRSWLGLRCSSPAGSRGGGRGGCARGWRRWLPPARAEGCPGAAGRRC
jgi:hypothetical protein